MADKIYTNHTLEEYKKKYRNRQYRLLKVTKKEVEDFHKKNPTVSKDYLLKDRKWWLIGDTYYEIPKAPRYTWFRNLNAGVQIVTCALLGAGVATAVVVPTVIAVNKNKTDSQNAEVTGTGKDLIKSVSFTKQSDGSYKGKIEIADGKSKSDIQEIVIKVGNKVLTKDTDYFISDSGDITIKAGVVTNNDNITIEVVKVNPIAQHTVTFKVDGQVTSTQTVNDGEKVNKPNDPEKTGYTFKCWNNGAAEYNFNQPVTKDLTLDAMFGATSYTITYDLDGGTNNPDNPETYTIETKTIALKDATKDEYTFSGWYDQATGGNKVTEIVKGSTGNKTLFARWTVVKVTSVTISNTSLFVGTGEEVELTASVLPENASNKKLNWTITSGSDKAEIVEKDNKTYLKGKDTTGDVTVKATSKDGSDKSDSKTFNVVPSYLEYTQVGQTDTCLVKAKSGKTLPENVVIPEKDPITSRTVIGIAPNGFSGTGLNVKTVTFENSDNITTISNDAFNNNNSLVSFTIPKNVEEIGDRAFKFDPSQAGQTRSLTTITIEAGSKLKKIGNLAFNWQTSLSSITAIPSTVEFIGKDAFWMTGLTSLTFADTTTNWVFNYDEIWTPSTDGSINATKLKATLGTGYYGVVKNTIDISGDSSVKTTSTTTLSIPEKYSVIEWKSSDTSIATVDSSTGVVTGVAVGSCYIYVVADEGARVGIKKIDVELLKTVNVTYDTASFTTVGNLTLDKQSSTFTNAGSLNFDVVSADDNNLQFHIIIKKQGGDTLYTSKYMVVEAKTTKSIKIDSKAINWQSLSDGDTIVVSIEYVISMTYDMSGANGITLVTSPNTFKKGETFSMTVRNDSGEDKTITIDCHSTVSGTIIKAGTIETINKGASMTVEFKTSTFNWNDLYINIDDPETVDTLQFGVVAW